MMAENRTLTFPKDLLRLLYWVFFKPVTLDRYIHKIDPTLGPDLSLLTLWRRGHDKPELRNLVALTFFYIIITPWLLGAFVVWILSLLGIPVNWFDVAYGVALSVAGGLALSVVFGMAGGVALSVAGGVAFGMAVGVARSVAIGVMAIVAYGVTASVVVGVVFGVAFGVARGVARGVAFGLAFGVVVGVVVGVAFGVVVGVAFGLVVGVADGVVVGAAFGVAFIVGYFRLFLYIAELPWSFMLSRLAYVGENALGLFRISSVKWDELIWLPLIGTDQHLIAISQENREAGKEEIAFVSRSFRQSWAARNALVELTARDLEGANTLEGTATIADKLAWLPPELPGELEAVLPPVRQVAQRVQAALESDTLYNRREQLQRAREEILAVRQSLSLGRAARIASRFGPILAKWQTMLERAVAALAAEEGIPNVYVAGGALATASKVFKGRRDLFLALERELTGPAEQRPTLLLFGPRRSGKTSVLRQLPVRLGPDFIPVEIDLQSGVTAEEASGLLHYLARQITENALLHRRIRLPTLKREALVKDPYMTFLDWLREAEKTVGQRLILLNLDEYERLQEMLEAGRLDQRIFHLLRGLIQHHPALVVLLSGSHTLEDLAPFWSDYLINVRVLRVGPLEGAAARELIVRPIPDFPLGYEEEAVARIIAATGCQPYLIQATCRDLVNYLNQQRRRHVTLADAEWALSSCLTSGVAYFQELWAGRDTDDTQRAVLLSIARSRGGMLSEEALARHVSYPGLRDALRRLQHRQILMPVDGQYCFQAELVRRWVQQQT